MGSRLSYPLVNEPDIYEDSDYDEDSVEADMAKQLHEINLQFCDDMIQLRVRSAAEHAKFEEYQSHWKTKVTEFQKMYPEWSEQDITHLKQQFELFDKDKDCLIEFKEL
ncbi:UNVERIFIED_CONTAM: hypothetical protein FKN15_065698 [Acipenser sinensis]